MTSRIIPDVPPARSVVRSKSSQCHTHSTYSDRRTRHNSISVSGVSVCCRVPSSTSGLALYVLVVFVTLLTSSNTRILISAQTVNDFVSGPTDVYQLVGQSASFDCTVLNSTGLTFIWTQIVDGGSGSYTLFVNGISLDSSRTGRYRAIYIPGGMRLILNGVVQGDDAMYQCQVTNLAPRSGRLTVVVEPGQPIVSLVAPSSASNLFENTVAQFACTSSGGNPAPNITWYRNGQSLPLSSTTSTITPSTTSVKFGVTTSVLTRTLTSDDNGANFSCIASSDVIKSVSVASAIAKYAVKYAPVISLGPYNPLILLENTRISLTCDVDANPVVSSGFIRWYKNGTELPVSGAVLTVPSAGKRDSGLYTCVASNYATRNASIAVNVQYVPLLQAFVISGGIITNGVLTVNESSTVNFTFTVDANPPPDEGSFQWFKDGVQIGSGRYLTLLSAVRNNSGLYVCNATNRMAPSGGMQTTLGYGSGSIQLSVLYKPGQAIVSGSRVSIVGDSVSLNCSVDDPGNPPATLAWSRDSDKRPFPTGSVLPLGVVALSDIGSYSCQPSNMMGSGQSGSIFLDVLQPARWSSPLLTPQIITVVNNSSPLSVNCSAYGRPPPVIQWAKNGQPLTLGDDLFAVTTTELNNGAYLYNVTSFLSWQGKSRQPLATSMSPDDNGQYSCTLESNISTSVSPQSINLIVRHAPIMNVTLIKIAVDARQSVQLICRCRSVPPPTFVWTGGDGALTSMGGQGQISRWEEPDDPFPFVSALNLSYVRQSDFGTYTCTASNIVGVSRTQINVTVKTVPDKPQSLVVVSTTWESIDVFLQPGFDGGYPQDFVFTVSAASRNSSERFESALPSFNITGLYPSTQYTISVTAENRLGRSVQSETLVTRTAGLPLSQPTAVRYATKTRTLSFQTASNPVDVCLWVKFLTSSSASWQTLNTQCPPPANGTVVVPDEFFGGSNVLVVEVMICVSWRPDVCSSRQNATIVTDDVPVEIIIIVVCVCGGVIIILSAILIVLCCRRRRKFNKNGSPPSSDLRTTSAVTYHQNGANHDVPMGSLTLGGYDNPVLDRTDFHTDKLFMDGSEYYRSDDLDPDGKTGMQEFPPPYRPRSSPPYGSNGSDSGVSDTPKPARRVIYEVVV